MSEKINFKPIHTTLEKLSTIPILNGQFILVKDEPSIFADIQNDRFKVADATDYKIVDINSGNLVGDFMKGCTYDRTYGFYIQKSREANSYTQYRTEAINFANISKLIIQGTIKNDGAGITNIGYIYITDNENATFNSSTWTETVILILLFLMNQIHLIIQVKNIYILQFIMAEKVVLIHLFYIFLQ